MEKEWDGDFTWMLDPRANRGIDYGFGGTHLMGEPRNGPQGLKQRNGSDASYSWMGNALGHARHRCMKRRSTMASSAGANQELQKGRITHAGRQKSRACIGEAEWTKGYKKKRK